MSMFRKAERKKSKLRLALCGPSGSGKTYSALKLAQGLGGRIAMIDTERGSGELYSHLCDYDVCQISAPFEVGKYIAAISAAEDAGYDTIIIDSLSHAWSAEGGLLDQVDKMKAQSFSKNSFTVWREATPQHNALVDAMLQSPCHVIASMRTKTAYEMQLNEKTNKLVPVKIGLAPVQREGMDYEFTVVFDLSIEKHLATSCKNRTGLFENQVFLISAETGVQLKQWLNSGAEPPPSDIERRAFCEAVAAALPGVEKGDLYAALSKACARAINSSADLIMTELSFFTENPGDLNKYLPTLAPAQEAPPDVEQPAPAQKAPPDVEQPAATAPAQEAPPPSAVKAAPTIEKLSDECWRLCNQKQLPMDNILKEMFPKTKKDQLTLGDWQSFRATLDK